MIISSRTPEGWPNLCPICHTTFTVEPSEPTGDAPCPRCGHLVWFARGDVPDVRPAAVVFPPRWSIRPRDAVAPPPPGAAASGESSAAGRHLVRSSTVTDVVQFVCSGLLICSIGYFVMIESLHVPLSALSRAFSDLVVLMGGLALLVLFFAQLASLFRQRWPRPTQRRGGEGSRSGGLWDRELDG
jgi:hypothetical protein